MNTRRTPSFEDLSLDQHAALVAFRDKHGRNWKAKLCDLWYRGIDDTVEDGALLRQVRNDLGPAWLAKLRREE